MKYQTLSLSLLGTLLGANLFGGYPATAKPAPIFQPIVREIRDRLPAEFKMRLPATLPEFTKDLPLFAFVVDDDIKIFGQDVFSVLISDIPGCEEEKDPSECTVGVIGVTEALSEEPLQPEDLPDDSEDLTPVALTNTAQGFYFVQDKQAQFVVWEQDELGYLLFSGKCESECLSKQQMIEIAKSAASEPAILSADRELVQ